MRKTTMDKVFDLFTEENRRFARFLEDADRIRPVPEKPEIGSDFVEAKRRQHNKDAKLSLCA